MNWEIHVQMGTRLNTREQADVIISLGLGKVDVAWMLEGLENSFRAGSRVATPFLHLKFTALPGSQGSSISSAKPGKGDLEQNLGF